MVEPWWLWAGFFVLIAVVMFVDLVVLHGGESHRVSLRESSSWVLAWATLALLFDAALYFYFSNTLGPAVAKAKAFEFLTGYLLEWSLSVDNLFVILLIFNYFAIPPELQRRTLLYGIVGAILMRLTFILLGVWLVSRFHWILYVFGVLLIYSGIKIFRHADKEPDLSQNPLLKWMRNHLRITHDLHKEHFFVRENNLLCVTPLFVVLVFVEISDVIFAIDSIPAIFAVTNDPFIIFTSNIFAILGLRAMYFMLAKMHEVFELLKHGVAFILVFIGVKMLIAPWFKIPIVVALGVIIVTLTSCILLSVIKNAKGKSPSRE